MSTNFSKYGHQFLSIDYEINLLKSREIGKGEFGNAFKITDFQSFYCKLEIRI